MTAKEVWEKMREECSWVCMNDATEGACGHESVNGDGPCAFDACPLLVPVGIEEEKR